MWTKYRSITLNPRKFIFGADVVEFAGFGITPSCVRPSNKYIQAIQNFPTPSNITDVRSWFGLVNQVSYAFSMTQKMMSFRELLTPGVPFTWNEQLDKLFDDSNFIIITEIENGVKISDSTKPTCLATDWSKDGIGFCLFKNIANVRARNHSVVVKTGRLFYWAVVLHMLQNLDMRLLKERLWQSQMYWIKPYILY